MFDKFFFTKFDNLPLLRSQEILIEISKKLFLKPIDSKKGEKQIFTKIFKSSREQKRK